MTGNEKVVGVCGLGGRLQPKYTRKLYSYSIRRGSGTHINSTCKFRLVGSGIAWTELEITNTGDTDCSPDLRIMVSTNYVLQSFNVDGYDTCPTCNGVGVIKQGYINYED